MVRVVSVFFMTCFSCFNLFRCFSISPSPSLSLCGFLLSFCHGSQLFCGRYCCSVFSYIPLGSMYIYSIYTYTLCSKGPFTFHALELDWLAKLWGRWQWKLIPRKLRIKLAINRPTFSIIQTRWLSNYLIFLTLQVLPCAIFTCTFWSQWINKLNQ